MILSKRNTRGLSTALLVAVCIGCGSSAPFEYIPVSGQLTYEDGSSIPAPGMKLQFEPLDAPVVEGFHARTATANLNAEGKFNEATSYKFGDGLIPGKHKVAIGYANDKAGKLLVPMSATNLGSTEIIVDTANLPLEIKVPKP